MNKETIISLEDMQRYLTWLKKANSFQDMLYERYLNGGTKQIITTYNGIELDKQKFVVPMSTWRVYISSFEGFVSYLEQLKGKDNG